MSKGFRMYLTEEDSGVVGHVEFKIVEFGPDNGSGHGARVPSGCHSTSRATPTASRRSPPSSSPTPPTASIARGATARSAASPRVPSSLNSTVTRRPSTKTSQAPPNGETREALSASLRQETEQKEQLLLQVQNRDQTITGLTAENNTLTSTLNAAEARLNELYADQARAEAEMAQRIDISDKLRAQVRELEKEKRDLQRRYNEQTTTFEAERQALYDNEQHLKSRILSLTQVRKQAEPEPESEAEPDDDEETSPQLVPRAPSPKLPDPATEPAEMTSLRLELSTLSTSYSSLQNAISGPQTCQSRATGRERELYDSPKGKDFERPIDLMRQVGGGSSDDDDDDEEEEDEHTDVGSLRSTGKSTLDRVDEEDNERSFDQELEQSLERSDSSSPISHSSRPGRNGRKRGTSPGARGESLADLPITGPGLDLAAELGRAENKDIISGNIVDDRYVSSGKHKRSKKSMDSRKVSLGEGSGLESSGPANDIDALRTEVKSLKDANKALSLYASKIIDRIISQEGFEHVLAVDYDKEPSTPSTAVPAPAKPMKENQPKPRPQSVIVGRSSSNPMPATDSSRFKSPPANGVPKLDNPPNLPSLKTQRRSLSFDWKGFFVAEKKPEPTLRPLTLKPGSSPVTGVAGARKLETYEDEEDRRERERLNATMKLMGIQPPAPSPSAQSPIQGVALQTPNISNSSTGTPNSNRRFSLWGSRANTDNSETTFVESSPSLDAAGNLRVGLGIGSSGLTQEALEHVEAENTLAALDAHERNLSAEIARGSNSGFTEIAPRSISGRRSKRSAGGSGSGGTVWSAGMSGNGEDGEE
ncbi:hypothetical protein BD779DRAFT_1464758 [Infundibulicybe gibba]|nr:hypothetical protein BD779DRAFT_1464758 [Infundibulicybe gibba]